MNIQGRREKIHILYKSSGSQKKKPRKNNSQKKKANKKNPGKKSHGKNNPQNKKPWEK